MTERETIFWIFLSTAIASQKEPADITSILKISDRISHSIPTHKEVQNSLTWLIKNGLIIKLKANIALPKSENLITKSYQKNQSSFRDLEKY